MEISEVNSHDSKRLKIEKEQFSIYRIRTRILRNTIYARVPLGEDIFNVLYQNEYKKILFDNYIECIPHGIQLYKHIYKYHPDDYILVIYDTQGGSFFCYFDKMNSKKINEMCLIDRHVFLRGSMTYPYCNAAVVEKDCSGSNWRDIINPGPHYIKCSYNDLNLLDFDCFKKFLVCIRLGFDDYGNNFLPLDKFDNMEIDEIREIEKGS